MPEKQTSNSRYNFIKNVECFEGAEDVRSGESPRYPKLTPQWKATFKMPKFSGKQMQQKLFETPFANFPVQR